MTMTLSTGRSGAASLQKAARWRAAAAVSRGLSSPARRAPPSAGCRAGRQRWGGAPGEAAPRLSRGRPGPEGRRRWLCTTRPRRRSRCPRWRSLSRAATSRRPEATAAARREGGGAARCCRRGLLCRGRVRDRQPGGGGGVTCTSAPRCVCSRMGRTSARSASLSTRAAATGLSRRTARTSCTRAARRSSGSPRRRTRLCRPCRSRRVGARPRRCSRRRVEGVA
mmetsp:Transcript_30326/g.90109  ORF Transcript_30326/g.90109 Transcript_30326/m.90109 type:complete len:224 (+) Transcript_30326:702-1373(+)